MISKRGPFIYPLILVSTLFLLFSSFASALDCPPGTWYYSLNNNPSSPLICLDWNSPYVAPEDRGNQTGCEHELPSQKKDETTCNSGWAPEPPSPSSCDVNLCGNNGFYFIDTDLKEQYLNLSYIVNVSQTAEYNVTISYRIGCCSSGCGQENENFTIYCGTKSYYIADNPSANPNISYYSNITGDFTIGQNQIYMNATFPLSQSPKISNSIHFEKFAVEACLPIAATDAPTNIFPFFTPLNLIITLLSITAIYILSIKHKKATWFQ